MARIQEDTHRCAARLDRAQHVGRATTHRAIGRTNALVGAAALVPNGMEVPSGAMALGVPARLKLDAVAPGTFLDNAANYVRNAQQYRTGLRRLD